MRDPKFMMTSVKFLHFLNYASFPAPTIKNTSGENLSTLQQTAENRHGDSILISLSNVLKDRSQLHIIGSNGEQNLHKLETF